MRFGIAVFPGTWSDRDCAWSVEQVLGHEMSGAISAVGTFATDGQPLEYHSDLAIYRNGQEVMRCTSTARSCLR